MTLWCTGIPAPFVSHLLVVLTCRERHFSSCKRVENRRRPREIEKWWQRTCWWASIDYHFDFIPSSYVCTYGGMCVDRVSAGIHSSLRVKTESGDISIIDARPWKFFSKNRIKKFNQMTAMKKTLSLFQTKREVIRLKWGATLFVFPYLFNQLWIAWESSGRFQFYSALRQLISKVKKCTQSLILRSLHSCQK